MRRKFFASHADFARLWSGQTISLLGTQVTLVALPLLAITTLHATTLQVGLLAASETLPFLLVGLPAGVWVDRLRKRPVLIAADAGRGLLLASIPVAYALDVLHMAQLFVVAFGVGVLTVFFDVSYLAYVPAVVEGDGLITANALLEASYSGAGTIGPGIGGWLVQALSAATAILVDTISYVVSALVLLGIRSKEAKPEPDGESTRALAREVREGLRYVLRHEHLAPIATSAAVFNLFSSMSLAMFLLYAVRDLHVTAAGVGLLFSAGGAAGLVATLLIARVGGKVRTGTALWLGQLMATTSFLLVPAAPRSHPMPFFVAAIVVESMFSPLFNVTQVSLRQAVTPSRLLGRMTATMRFIVWGTLPVGSLLGGVLGAALGRHTTLWIGAVGGTLAVVPLLLPRLRRLQAIPTT